jgi:actin-related protein
MFWANIGVIGGNTKFSGFHQRLYAIAVIRTARRDMALTMNQHDGIAFACSGRFRDKHFQV